jgi:diguanylate cyclase
MRSTAGELAELALFGPEPSQSPASSTNETERSTFLRSSSAADQPKKEGSWRLAVKKWIQKFVDQLDNDRPTESPSEGHDGSSSKKSDSSEIELSEDRATLLFFLDTYSKHVIETENSPARRVRESIDSFAKNILRLSDESLEKTYFQLRQFISSHRIEESTYVQKSFDQFRRIIWDLIESLSQNLAEGNADDLRLDESLEKLREAVEADSVEQIKNQSRDFINQYIHHHEKRDIRKSRQADTIKKKLSSAKKQLVDANNSLRLDHLTQAYNRKNFEEQIQQQWNLFHLTKQPVSLVMLDIDYFKRINDTYGHAMGDIVLVACVKMLKELYPRDVDSVSRIGGEEFAILLPDYQIEHAVKKCEAALTKIRSEAIVDQDVRVQFTVSMGIAQLIDGESVDQWMKRADAALYEAKENGRDRFVTASHILMKKDRVA